MNKGILIAVAPSITYNFLNLAKLFISRVRILFNIPICLVSIVDCDLPVDHKIQIDQNYKNDFRKLITFQGKQIVDFSIKIKLQACLQSPFEQTLWCDLDYLFLETNIERYFQKPNITFPGKIYWIGDSINDKDLVFSWIFKFSQNDKPFIQKVLTDIDQFKFVDRSFYHNLKKYQWDQFDFPIWGSGYKTKFLGIEDNLLKFKYKEKTLYNYPKDVHVPDKNGLLTANNHCSPST